MLYTPQSDTCRSSEWLRCEEGEIGKYMKQRKGGKVLNIVSKFTNKV